MCVEGATKAHNACKIEVLILWIDNLKTLSHVYKKAIILLYCLLRMYLYHVNNNRKVSKEHLLCARHHYKTSNIAAKKTNIPAPFEAYMWINK